jgi:hypothetical protein
MNYIMDRDGLVKHKKIILGSPDTSRIIVRLKGSDAMPCDGTFPGPDETETKVLRDWISTGAPPFDEAAPLPPRVFLSQDVILASIRDDLLTLGKEERLRARYFTITHLANAGRKEDELETYRHAISKLVNSLSWGHEVVLPREVNGTARTVMRIDLDDYGWNASLWNKIIDAYPFGVVYDRTSDPTASAVYNMTGCALPYLRADWFVKDASRPPLYHVVLQLPETDTALEKDLLDAKHNVTIGDNIRNRLVARAGFRGSGVSNNNRVIERHKSPNGAYWKSYDFANNVGTSNIFENPLGPGAGSHSFIQAGGEIIFSLPNGLQGYMLVNKDGKRINVAPDDIVNDRRNPRSSKVFNGISCMSCHNQGINPKEDGIRKRYSTQPETFTEAEWESVRAIYPEQSKLDALYAADRARFESAVTRTGAPPGKSDPIVALSLHFDEALDLALAAAEAGMEVQDFLKRLSESSGLDAKIGQVKVEGGLVERDTYLDAFPELVQGWKHGTFLRPLPAPPWSGPPTVTLLSPVPGEVLIRRRTSIRARIEPRTGVTALVKIEELTGDRPHSEEATLTVDDQGMATGEVAIPFQEREANVKIVVAARTADGLESTSQNTFSVKHGGTIEVPNRGIRFDFSATTIEGKQIDLKEDRGLSVIVQYTQWDDADAEILWIKSLRRKYPEGVRVIGVGSLPAGSVGKWKAYLEARGASWEHVADTDNLIFKRIDEGRSGVRTAVGNFLRGALIWNVRDRHIVEADWVETESLEKLETPAIDRAMNK